MCNSSNNVCMCENDIIIIINVNNINNINIINNNV